MIWGPKEQAAVKKEKNRLRMARNYRRWAAQNLERKRELSRNWMREYYKRKRQVSQTRGAGARISSEGHDLGLSRVLIPRKPLKRF